MAMFEVVSSKDIAEVQCRRYDNSNAAPDAFVTGHQPVSGNASNWSSVRISSDMWNVYKGDDFAGYIARVVEPSMPSGFGWRTEVQRTPRPSAYLAACDQWGSDAAVGL